MPNTTPGFCKGWTEPAGGSAYAPNKALVVYVCHALVLLVFRDGSSTRTSWKGWAGVGGRGGPRAWGCPAMAMVMGILFEFNY